jgi:hypothetical protein
MAVVSIFILTACLEGSLPEPPEPVYTIDYDEFQRFITLYLTKTTANASASVNTDARAIKAYTAGTSYNFYEAVFQSGAAIARISWKRGDTISISNVPRGKTYTHTGADRAILFAGRDEGKEATLLAVGTIYSVDGVEGSAITEASTYVTFELFPLVAGVSPVLPPAYVPFERPEDLSPILPEAKDSSFLIASRAPYTQATTDNTDIIIAWIGSRYFPLYKLPGGVSDIKATYEYNLDGAEWSEFASNIIVSQEGGRAEKREARYAVGNGRYMVPVYPEDGTTVVKMENNRQPGYPAEKLIKFAFDTTDAPAPTSEANGLFTLTFEIPVYAYTNAAATPRLSIGTDAETGAAIYNDPVRWFIRPSYASYRYNIDDGENKQGGAVLMGVNVDDQLEEFIHKAVLRPGN